MSMRTLEQAILTEAKDVLKNQKLRMKDILEWSTGNIKAQDDTEMVLRLPEIGVNLCVAKKADKR